LESIHFLTNDNLYMHDTMTSLNTKSCGTK